MTHFHGLPTRVIRTRHLEVEYLAEAGPRLVRLTLAAAPALGNLLAETPQIFWPTPHGDYFLRGGHRFWHAPEAAGRSSVPDSVGLELVELADGVRLCQSTEPVTGMRKSLEIRVCSDRPALRLNHVLVNEGVWPVETAPWAITQLALGGVAVLPQTRGPLDPHGLQPNRSLVLWPYTRIADDRLELQDDFWLVHGRPQQSPCKLGYLNRQGWAGYLRNGIMLIKRFGPVVERPFPDWGCNVEVYCNDLFLELETLAALSRLEPGQSVSHVEQWEFVTGLDRSPTHQSIRDLVQALPVAWLQPLGMDELFLSGIQA